MTFESHGSQPVVFVVLDFADFLRERVRVGDFDAVNGVSEVVPAGGAMIDGKIVAAGVSAPQLLMKPLRNCH